MKRQREAEAEAKKYADAWTDLNNAGDGWRRTLDGIDDETRAAAQYYVNAGASLGAVATAFGLTAVQAHALAEAHKDEIARS
jgi:predicted trehalose synthase